MKYALSLILAGCLAVACCANKKPKGNISINGDNLSFG
jgi:hypothetical protein